MRIIYVDVDTLRADHTTPYGYHRNTTPNLQRLADKGVTFDRYYASDSPCLPSRTALTSGQFGITNGVIGHFGEAAQFRLDPGHGPHPQRPLLGQVFQRNNWYPAAVSMFAERHRAYFFTGNFRETIRATAELGDEPADEINHVALDWIRRHRDDDNWYLHLTYWDPHTDYLTEPGWTERAAALGPAPAWPDQEAIDSHAEVYGPRSALDLHYSVASRRSAYPHNMPDEIRTRADFEHLINGYDGTILYWDQHFGQLLDTLDELGLTDDTAIIVSADHGESFGENGSYAEHGLANEATHRLPLIVYWPGVTDDLTAEQRRCEALLYNIDYAPTLCDLVGFEIPPGWQGTSFAPAIRGENVLSREHLVLGHGAHTYQRAVRTRDHMYIRTYHPGAFRAEWEQLFNITEDPHLEHDLLEAEPERADWMRARLAEWEWEHAGRPGCLPDPMLTTMHVGPTFYNDPVAYAHHLRSTGREHLAEDLEERLRNVQGVTEVWWHAGQEPWPPGRREAFLALIGADPALD
ncbi:MAG: sulfatase [Actinomycetales bacterium]